MPKRGRVWDYFTIADKDHKRARCNNCKRSLSYKTTISNLKNHLKQRHIDFYDELCNKLKVESTNEGDSNEKNNSEEEEEVIYEYVVDNTSPSCSASENDERTKDKSTERATPSIRMFRKGSTLKEIRAIAENATGKSKEKTLIEKLTDEKMQVTLLQKELIQKELHEKSLKILLVEKEIEHKNMVYEQDRKEMEHKNYMNDLQKESMALKIELLKASLTEVRRRLPDPDLPIL